MFLDASAFCAMLMNEADASTLASKLKGHHRRITSPMAIWETAVSVSRGLGLGLEEVQGDIAQFLAEFEIDVIPIPTEAASLALDAYRRYGKGRHQAALNFGDCFAYACARHHNVPLLFKGNDFNLTDIAVV